MHTVIRRRQLAFCLNTTFLIPVVDDTNRLVGIISVDDLVDVIQEEATEDIQKLGGSEPWWNPTLRPRYSPFSRSGLVALVYSSLRLSLVISCDTLKMP